jgi:uncharacterized protein YbjT (DUF2867 family)
MNIVIAGGTGLAGRVLAARAAASGHQVRALSRSGHGPDLPGVEPVAADLLTGSGVPAALAGTDAVVDLSNIATASYRRASRFYRAATRSLLAAERTAGVRHHVVLSIVGVDRFPTGYYRAKVDQEQIGATAAAGAGVTHTIARVTQFHDFAAMTYAGARLGPFVLAAPLHLRPVHLDDVAAHLLRLLEEPRPGRAPDLSGPQAEDLDDMVRRYAAVRGTPARVLRLPLPGAYGRANRARVLAPAEGRRGTLTFADWLSAQTPAADPATAGARSVR